MIHEYLNDTDRQTHISHALKLTGDCDAFKTTLELAKNSLKNLEKLLKMDNIVYSNYVKTKYSNLRLEYAEYLTIYNQWLNRK